MNFKTTAVDVLYRGLSSSLTWLDKHATAAGVKGTFASQILPEPVWPSLRFKLILQNSACGGLREQRSLVIECLQITGITAARMQNVSLSCLNQQHFIQDAGIL